MSYDHHKTSQARSKVGKLLRVSELRPLSDFANHIIHAYVFSDLFNRAMVEIPKDLCTNTHVASVGSAIPNHKGFRLLGTKSPQT